ncbi:transmembrane protein 47-like isoform X3 [Mya arenaria]|uniref:transmembrane protein 47-like isoform X3 n=1 Tax=Mya arenaria TaxID=6604 RepID=UPI0022E85C68|nr:transmembrane protein 47-like isoform X3 [Mya arenaria]
MSLLENLGFICLVITVATMFISFVTPYWVVDDGDYIMKPVHKGLLANCEEDMCTWIFKDERINREFPAWFNATQGLMSVALALGLIALLVATLSLCCTCHSCNPHHPICGFLIIASVSIAVAIVVFGIKAKNEWDIDFQMELMSRGRFGWSFWTAVGAAASALLTSTIYCCMDRKRH